MGKILTYFCNVYTNKYLFFPPLEYNSLVSLKVSNAYTYSYSGVVLATLSLSSDTNFNTHKTTINVYNKTSYSRRLTFVNKGL